MKFYRIKALLLKYYYISINRVDRIFDIFYWPLIDILVWGFASNYIKSLSDVNVLSVILGSLILWVFVWRSSQDIAVFVLEDYWSKNLYHLFSSPVKISEHVVSIILLGFLRGMLSFMAMAFFAYILHSFNIFVIPIGLLGLSILLLSIFGWVMGLFVTSFILRFGQRIQVLAWSIVWILQPFSCVFYPLSSLPAWAASIAKWLPTTYVFENLRQYIFQNTVSYNGFAVALVIEIVLVIAVSVFLYNSFKYAKDKGLLAKAE